MTKFFLAFFFITVISNAQIVNIPDANFKAKLIALGLDTNNDSNIQQSEVMFVVSLYVNNSTISDLTGIKSFISLEYLYCDHNMLTSLDVSGMPNLRRLSCHYNQITNLNVANLNLEELNCSYNNLSTLDLSSTGLASEFSCISNSLTSLDLSGKQFAVLRMSSNLFTTLDLSTCPNLGPVSIGDCPFLTTLNAKNGRDESLQLQLNPSLQFICADEVQVAYLQQSYPNSVVSSYCTFVPGGNYNTISGSVKFDANGNGCDVSDTSQPNIRIDIANGTNQGTSFTNNDGDYKIYTAAGTIELTPFVENPSYFTFSPPTATVPFANNNNNTSTQNFCLSPNGNHSDLEIVIVPIAAARPGFDASYNIVYRNKGNQVLSGNIGFTYQENLLDYISASPLPNSQTSGNLTWNYSNLFPFQSRIISVILNVNAPTEIPAVNIGNQLDFSAVANPITGDELPADNTFDFEQEVVGSFDPNEKICMEGTIISPSKIGDYLHYTVNFENTGTAPATFIVVKDMIDTAKFDIATLQVMHASHPMVSRITGDKVEFIFDNINLGASQHGNVVFKIKTKSNLVDGNTVTNRADIYFDYNFPVDTGIASTTFQSLGHADFATDNSIVVYPNPASTQVTIKGDYQINSIQMYDMHGRLLHATMEKGNNVLFDISQRANGIYFLKITSDNGTKTVKVVRE